jgi:copper chaperone CopZ
MDEMRTGGEGMTIELAIDGMHCQGCIEVVRTALGTLPGVRVRGVGMGTALVEVERGAGSVEVVLKGLERLGYEGRVTKIQGDDE